MTISDMPPWLVFLVTSLLIGVVIEVGYRLGTAVRNKTDDEKEAPVSAITGTVLALLAFILAFTFGIVSDRYDARKGLVREQAITISAAYSRTDFLPETARDEARALLRTYMDTVLAAAEPENSDRRRELIGELDGINTQLWTMGVEHANLDPDSEMLALYMDSLSSVGDVQALRDSVAVQSRIPNGIWASLLALVFLAMLAVGYQVAVARSRRTWVLLLLALSFSTVVSLIAMMDDPDSRFLRISQDPLVQVQASMTDEPAP